MSATKVALLGILVQLAAVISSILAPRLQRKLGFSNLKLLLYIVMLTGIVPAYGSLGLLLPFGGLRTEAEMYAAATWFGMVSLSIIWKLDAVTRIDDSSCMVHSIAILELFMPSSYLLYVSSRLGVMRLG